MRFDAKSYDKLFPRPKETPKVESNVETFKPTEEEQELQNDIEPVDEIVEEEQVDVDESSGEEDENERDSGLDTE